MRAGDIFTHPRAEGPLLAACVKEGFVYNCGWPCDGFPVDACTLIKECSDSWHWEIRRLCGNLSPSDPRYTTDEEVPCSQ